MADFRGKVLKGRGPVVVTYRYERVGDRTWRKDGHIDVRPARRAPAPSASTEEQGDRVLVHVYEMNPRTSAGHFDDTEVRLRADDVLRKEYAVGTIMDPDEGRG
jgi:hypothetical protein